MVILTESIIKPANVIFCLGTKTDLPGCMVRPRLLKRLNVSMILFKQITAVSSMRRELSKYFHLIIESSKDSPLDLKKLDFKRWGHDFCKFPYSWFKTIRQHSVPKVIIFPLHFQSLCPIFLTNFYLSPNDSSSKTMTHVFYFI